MTHTLSHMGRPDRIRTRLVFFNIEYTCVVPRIILVQTTLIHVNDFDFRAVATYDSRSEFSICIITAISTVVT
jgi:hypothetical protein